MPFARRAAGKPCGPYMVKQLITELRCPGQLPTRLRGDSFMLNDRCPSQPSSCCRIGDHWGSHGQSSHIRVKTTHKECVEVKCQETDILSKMHFTLSQLCAVLIFICCNDSVLSFQHGLFCLKAGFHATYGSAPRSSVPGLSHAVSAGRKACPPLQRIFVTASAKTEIPRIETVGSSDVNLIKR